MPTLCQDEEKEVVAFDVWFICSFSLKVILVCIIDLRTALIFLLSPERKDRGTLFTMLFKLSPMKGFVFPLLRHLAAGMREGSHFLSFVSLIFPPQLLFLKHLSNRTMWITCYCSTEMFYQKLISNMYSHISKCWFTHIQTPWLYLKICSYMLINPIN